MKTIRTVIVIAISAFLFYACNIVEATSTKDASSLKTTLGEQQAKWIAQNISHYRYSVEFVCLCPGVDWPLTVEIKDGQVVSATDAAGVPLSSDRVAWYSKYLIVDRLFGFLQSYNKANYDIGVTFFETGAPRQVSIVAKKCETECTFEITMSNFEKLP